MDKNQKHTIAVLEGSVATLDAVQVVLESRGWEVNVFQRGQRFLDVVAFSTYDCLVLNPHLPDMSGIDVVHHINTRRYPLPVVVLTANPCAPQTLALKRYPVHDILTKPVSELVLIDSVSSAIGDVH